MQNGKAKILKKVLPKTERLAGMSEGSQ